MFIILFAIWMRNLARACVINWQSKFGLFKSAARANERKKNHIHQFEFKGQIAQWASVRKKKSFAYYLLYIHLHFTSINVLGRAHAQVFIYLTCYKFNSFIQKYIARSRCVFNKIIYLCECVCGICQMNNATVRTHHTYSLYAWYDKIRIYHF